MLTLPSFRQTTLDISSTSPELDSKFEEMVKLFSLLYQT